MVQLVENRAIAPNTPPVIPGALTAVVVCPLDVLKTRLQVQRSSNNKYTGIGGAHRQASLCIATTHGPCMQAVCLESSEMRAFAGCTAA